ncbi:MAG: SRPBCC family protein [Bryobacter sp.]|nr:SRPBCC family protein [Bryobacter sp. CoA8 C33]
MPKFVLSAWIDAPLERVWAFHEAPEALERLMPPGQKMRVNLREGGIREGGRVVIAMPLLGLIPVEWHARHTVYEPMRRFVDEQEKGPFAYWRHEHRMEAEGTGTRLTDEIEYRLPGGSFVNWVGGIIVRQQLKRLFQYRHKVTKRFCE